MENNAAQLNADISALISTIPDALNLLSTSGTIPTTKSSALSTGDLPMLMSSENLNTMSALSFLMLQQQQMQLIGMNPFVFGSMPNGIQGFTGLDALNLANLARPQSQSAIPSPKQSVSSDMRPRAFSSAATLQPSMLPGEKKRKRSHQETFVPLGTVKHSSVLRGLVESDEEPLPPHAPPTKSENDRLMEDISKDVSVLAKSKPEQPPKKKAPEDCVRLRPLIRDEDLPDSVGPDSPFRHHPKYQRKNFGLDKRQDETDAVAFAVASGMWNPSHSGSSSVANSSAGNSPKPADYHENSQKCFHEMLDQALTRELSGH